MKRITAVVTMVVFFCLSGLQAAWAQADCVTLVSQNTLHFGYNQPINRDTKFNDHFVPLFRNVSQRALILFQEVMRLKVDAVKPTNSYNPFIPGNFPLGQIVPDYTTDTVKKGWSSYKEAYGFVRPTNLVESGRIISGILGYESVFGRSYSAPGDFIRPPSAVLVRCPVGPGPAITDGWVVNYHAYFGDGKHDPLREAMRMGGVAADFMNCGYGAAPVSCSLPAFGGGPVASWVIMAGDWNVPAADVLAQMNSNPLLTACCTINVYVTQETSINTAGLFSSAYDHFVVVYRNPAPVPLRPALRLMPLDGRLPFTEYSAGPLTGLQYRSTTSDHIGVRAVVEN